MKNRHKTAWMIDAVMFAAFLILFLLDLTGLSLHQWLGMAVGALAVYHLLAHWTWVKSVARRFFDRASRQSKVYLLVDACLMLGFLLIVSTGLVISTWLELPLSNYPAWRNLHVFTSVVTLLWIVIKIALHWRWVTTTARRHVFTPRSTGAQPAQQVRGTPSMERREFLRLMGLVGAAAVLSAGTALGGFMHSSARQSPSPQADSEGLAPASGQDASTSTGSAPGAPSRDCVVRCSRGCSYPGSCRRYTDANGNGRCDWGECL